MPKLRSGGSVSLTISSTDILTVKGSGFISKSPGSQEIINGGTFGPYGLETKITLNATSDLTYDTGAEENTQYSVNIRKTNLGTRMLSGRMGAFDNTTQKTFRAIIEVANTGFCRVRPIFANGSASATYTVSLCNVRALANLTDALPSPTSVTLPSSGVVPVAAAAGRRNYLLGNWVDIVSVPRTDGGSGALLCIDAYVSSSASINIMGNGSSDDFTGWATRANRKYIMRYNDGDCVTTPANFVSTTNRIQSPIVGVQYLSMGRVITVLGTGDSVVDGRGTIVGEGFVVPACELASNSRAYFENANIAWAGLAAASFRSHLSDAVSAGIVPDVAVFECGSHNSFSTPIVAADINSCKSAMVNMLETAYTNNIHPIVTSTVPLNPSVKDYNSSDSLRVALNTEALAMPGVNTLDIAKPVNGVTDADGQISFLVGTTDDNAHPNNYGNSLIASMLAMKLSELE